MLLLECMSNITIDLTHNFLPYNSNQILSLLKAADFKLFKKSIYVIICNKL